MTCQHNGATTARYKRRSIYTSATKHSWPCFSEANMTTTLIHAIITLQIYIRFTRRKTIRWHNLHATTSGRR